MSTFDVTQLGIPNNTFDPFILQKKLNCIIKKKIKIH